MKFSDLSKDIDLRIEIPHLDLSLDVTASPNKPLSDIMKDIARALKQSRPGETHEKYLSKMNLRCPARMNSTWLSPDSNLRTYESLFSFNWRLEFFTKKVKIHIGFESVTVNIDLRKPMSYVLRQLAKKYRIISPDEYGFLATISSKKLKDLKEENTKLATIAQKHWKEMEKQNLKGKDEDARFWLDLNRSFSDNPLMIINPDARISLSRMIFYNYNAITAQNMHEAAILFEQLRDMAASNHFTSLTNKLALSLLQLAISIEYAGRLDKITPKSLDQSKYLPKDKFVSHKQILTDIQRYSAKSTIELQYNYLDILRSLPEWGKECFYVKDMKEKKNCTLEISKKGVNIVPSNAKKGDTGQLYSFNRIQSFKYLDTTMTIKISNGQILSYQTEEGYKIATALSSYIDCEKGNKKVQKILLPTEAKAKSEQIASISFVRNIRQDAPDITNTTSQLNSANSRRRMLARLMKNTDMDLFGMLHYGMTNSHVSKMQVGSSTEKGTVSNWMDDLQQLIANLNKSQKTDITAPKDVLLGESEKMFHNTSNSHALNQTSGSIFEFQSSINPDSSLEDVIKSLHGVEQYINSLIGTGVIADSFNDSDNSALYSKIIPLCDFISPAQRGSQKNHDLFDKILEILEKIRDSSKQYDSGLIDYAELQVSQAALMESLTKIKIEFDSKLKKLPDQEDLEKICGMLSDLCAILATNPLIALNSAGSAQFAAKTQQLSSFIANMKSSKKTINELLRQLRSILNDPVEPTASSYSESCMSPRFAAYFEDVISTGDSK
ncbi:MAG: Talin-2, partial [Marteilia pararefringens]